MPNPYRVLTLVTLVTLLGADHYHCFPLFATSIFMLLLLGVRYCTVGF